VSLGAPATTAAAAATTTTTTTANWRARVRIIWAPRRGRGRGRGRGRRRDEGEDDDAAPPASQPAARVGARPTSSTWRPPASQPITQSRRAAMRGPSRRPDSIKCQASVGKCVLCEFKSARWRNLASSSRPSGARKWAPARRGAAPSPFSLAVPADFLEASSLADWPLTEPGDRGALQTAQGEPGPAHSSWPIMTS
jgi:hypothetical protein